MLATLTTDQIRGVVLESLGKIVPEVAPEAIAPDQSLRDQLDLDSMDFLNFVIAIAEALGVEIGEESYDQLTTLDGCIAFLAAQSRSTRARRIPNLTV